MPVVVPANGRFSLTVRLGGILLQGPPGPPGVGVPPGGTTGQTLTKLSDSDYDAGWRTPVGGGGSGGGTVQSVNRVLPDGVGNVQLTPENVGAVDEDEELTILEIVDMWNNA